MTRKVTIRRHNLGYNVSPHAIFWRPINYFSLAIKHDSDELDDFSYVSYALNNEVFDLRHYSLHPNFTVTLYLPSEIVLAEVIESNIESAVKLFCLPKSAIAWRRGEELNFGKLERRKNDRLKENEARLLVLKIAAAGQNHQATTSEIKRQIPNLYQLSDQDQKKSETRENESLWEQIVRNVKVHREGRQSIFSRGWAEPTADGIRLTESGLTYLKSIGFDSL